LREGVRIDLDARRDGLPSIRTPDHDHLQWTNSPVCSSGRRAFCNGWRRLRPWSR
jgi:hypothetical protein